MRPPKISRARRKQLIVAMVRHLPWTGGGSARRGSIQFAGAEARFRTETPSPQKKNASKRRN